MTVRRGRRVRRGRSRGRGWHARRVMLFVGSGLLAERLAPVQDPQCLLGQRGLLPGGGGAADAVTGRTRSLSFDRSPPQSLAQVLAAVHWSLQPPAPRIAHSLAFLAPATDILNIFLKIWDRKGPYRGLKYPASFWAEAREAGVARGEVPPRGGGLRARMTLDGSTLRSRGDRSLTIRSTTDKARTAALQPECSPP